MTDREKLMKGLECCAHGVAQCHICPYDPRYKDFPVDCITDLAKDALELLKAQEQYRRLQVHNVGNVDIPDGVTFEQFQAVMNGVIDALEHTEKGESWPYEEQQKEDAP